MSGCFLVDTCTLLWATAEPAKLSPLVASLISDRTNRILVSHASIWELSIKATIGKIQLPEHFFTSLPEMGYETLNLRDDHFLAYRQLPLLHRDPFDRLLVAQAQCEAIPLLTTDPQIAAYAVRTVW